MNSLDCLTIFVHIPKTAGSTFHMLLNSRYDKSKVRNVFGSRYSEPEIAAFIKEPESAKANIELLKGHMPYGLHKHTPHKKFRYISILRDPIDRVISQYYYIKKNSYNPLHKKVHLEGMSIGDFVSSGVAVGMNNGHCRFLNGDLDEYKFNACDEQLLSSVKSNISQHFLWVGLTERFDESILLLANLLGWSKPPYYIRENISKSRKPRSSISIDEIEMIKNYNELDIQLYEFANALLDEKISSIPAFEEELEKFKFENLKIQKRWGWLPERLKHYVI